MRTHYAPGPVTRTLARRRICLHLWRERDRWYSGRRGKAVEVCKPCRATWTFL